MTVEPTGGAQARTTLTEAATTREAPASGQGPAQALALYAVPDTVSRTWDRVDTHHRVEGYVLRALLERWLPPAPARLADIGGGNGRWALELAGRGYRVALLDLVPALVADAAHRNRAAGRPLDAVLQADARRLPWPNQAFDAALVLGPLYHLFDRADRVAALDEAARVVRSGGVVLVQSLNRVGALRQVLTFFGADAGPIDWRWFWDHGTFAEPKAPPFYASTYWHTPHQLRDEIADAGLEVRTLQGLDGPAAEGQATLAGAPDWAVEQWGQVALTLGADPALHATSNHLLAIGTRPGDG